MTNEEKFQGIIERMKKIGEDLDPHHVSVMVIIGYLDALQKKGLIECAFNMTPVGNKIMSICDEFEWKPSDVEVRNFVNEMVDEQDRPAFGYMIKRYRDDREGLFEEIERFREGKSEE